MSSPTQRTLDHWRKQGGIAAVVEKTIPYKFIKQDVWGFCDAIVCHPLWPGTVYIQTTSAQNVNARMKKILNTPEIAANVKRVLGAGNTVLVEGWAKRMKNKRTVGHERVAFRCVQEGEKLRFERGG